MKEVSHGKISEGTHTSHYAKSSDSHSKSTQYNFAEKFALRFISCIILLFAIIIAFYTHIFGKITAGGGFQAGAILASGIIIFEFINSVKIFSRKALNNITFSGLAIYFAVGFLSVFLDGTLFQYDVIHHKDGHIIGSFIIESGVLLVVLSSMIRISHLLGK